MPISTYTVLWLLRYFTFLVDSDLRWFLILLCAYENQFVITGILLAMGYALLGCHFWFSNCARSFGHYCWPSLLLPNSTASTCWREDHTEDTRISVSLCVAFHFDISNRKCLKGNFEMWNHLIVCFLEIGLVKGDTLRHERVISNSVFCLSVFLWSRLCHAMPCFMFIVTLLTTNMSWPNKYVMAKQQKSWPDIFLIWNNCSFSILSGWCCFPWLILDIN